MGRQPVTSRNFVVSGTWRGNVRGSQQLRHHRHRHEVNAAQPVAAQLIEIGVHHRGHEYYGGVLKARMFTNHRGKFKAVEVGHAHIDQDERHFVPEQALESLARRTRFEQILADLGQHHFVAQ